jgi:hypothetical protein
MKRCPSCNTTYSDDTLAYCLSDGTPLYSGKGYDSEATLVANLPPMLPTTVQSPPPAYPSSQTVVEKRTQMAPLILMLGAGVIIGLLITYIFLRPTAAPSQLTRNQPANSASINMTQTKPRETASIKPPPVRSTPTVGSSAPQDIRWFVVLGTFAASDRAGANERLERMRSEGFRDVYIVDTNNYSNFTPDRLAVVLGPYSESDARRIGSQVRSLNPTIKPGW